MKAHPCLILLASLAAGLSIQAAEPPAAAPAPAGAAPAAPALSNPAAPAVLALPATNVVLPAPAAAGAPAPGTNTLAPGPDAPALGATNALGTNALAEAGVTNTYTIVTNGYNTPDTLRLNFRGVPLEMVLNYMSEAAGFIIVLETEAKGKVDVWSNQPVTRDEAVALLNSVLRKNGYAAIRNDRTLTIDLPFFTASFVVGCRPRLFPEAPCSFRQGEGCGRRSYQRLLRCQPRR